MQRVQQKAKQVIATATFKNIITSSNQKSVNKNHMGKDARISNEPSRPLRMAAKATSWVENINTKPPHAKKKLPRASVGGLEGSIDLGGPSHRKKYVKHLNIEKASNKLPHSEW